MRSRLIAFAPALLLVGCQDKTSSPTSAGTPPTPTTAATPTPNEPPPNTPVAGLIKGKPFTPDQVFLEGTALVFRRGKGFFPDMEIRFDLPKKNSAKLDGQEWKFGGGKFGDPFVQVSFKEGENLPKLEQVSPDDYTMTVRITKHTPKTIEGAIALGVTKPANTHLAGTFQGTVKKTAFDPLDADDAPYVQGKIAVAGDWKTEQISAGFVGKGTDGTSHSNNIGSKITSGEPTWMTNSSFEPQLSSLTNDAKAGPMYRHVHMPPGDYWVFARRGGVMAAWKKVTVKAGDQQTVDLAIDPAKTGELVVTIPDEETNQKNDWHLSVIPAEIELPGLGWDYSFNAAEVKSGQKSVTVKGVPAGKYKLIRGQAEGEAEVTAGKSTAVTMTMTKKK